MKIKKSKLIQIIKEELERDQGNASLYAAYKSLYDVVKKAADSKNPLTKVLRGKFPEPENFVERYRQKHRLAVHTELKKLKGIITGLEEDGLNKLEAEIEKASS